MAGLSVAAAALLWAAVAETGVVQQTGPEQAVQTRPRGDEGDRARLFGQAVATDQPLATAAKSAGPELRLVGVMASGNQGLALIASADGTARVFRVGAVVHGDTVVKSVSAHEVRLGPRDGPASTVLVVPTTASGGASPLRTAHESPPLVVDGANDTSPIVPPHTDMPTPRASESGTAGSYWSELRAKPAAVPKRAGEPVEPPPR